MDTKNIGDSVIWNSNIGTHNGVIKNFVYYGDKEFIQLQCDALIQEIENTKEMLDKVKFRMNVIKIGQRYILNNNEEDVFILAQVGSFKVCLIGLVPGNRWNDPVEVNDLYNISKDEFECIVYPADAYEFTLI